MKHSDFIDWALRGSEEDFVWGWCMGPITMTVHPNAYKILGVKPTEANARGMIFKDILKSG